MGNPLAQSLANSSQRDEHSLTTTHVLIVDDDEQVLVALGRILKRAGYEPVLANNGKDAFRLVELRSFAVILSDINMPMMNGMDFLRKVREHDLDVPVLMVTGEPSVKTAATAIKFGAFRYLLKPIQPKELIDAVHHAARMHKLANLKRNALEILGSDRALLVGDHAGLETRFNYALETLWLALQPIVSCNYKKIVAYEALMRTNEETLAQPNLMILAAERLNRLTDMGRLIRKKTADLVRRSPVGMKVFINLHSLDLNDEELYSITSPLSLVANQIVLEVTERASLEGVRDLSDRVLRLREIGFQIAVDDLGAGYAGLNSFTQLNPEIIKLDMSLIRGVDRDPKKQSVIRSMAKLSKELGMISVAEGVETKNERDMIQQLGCDLLQGYLFAKPSRGFSTVRFD
jgi:EAL domain-containing protein (putative c-di-GMP-specific phosphodiesterase class I)/CheY-like chemotaxis protein